MSLTRFFGRESDTERKMASLSGVLELECKKDQTKNTGCKILGEGEGEYFLSQKSWPHNYSWRCSIYQACIFYFCWSSCVVVANILGAT